MIQHNQNDDVIVLKLMFEQIQEDMASLKSKINSSGAFKTPHNQIVDPNISANQSGASLAIPNAQIILGVFVFVSIGISLSSTFIT